jgi:lysophospholipase L1-like esterase
MKMKESASQTNFFKFLIVVIPFILVSGFAKSQSIEFKWSNPLIEKVPVVEGRMPGQLQNSFSRFPTGFQQEVDKNIVKEANQSSGLLIRFQTDADEIVIKYTVDNKSEKPDMSAIATSGIDLYAVDADGKFYWCNGNYPFGDTIIYHFSNLKPNDKYHPNGREYRLYLPLFASVRSLKVGVPQKADFTFLQTRVDKPIVIYGGATVQGAAATRPGLSWAAILGRKLDRPIINLGFAAEDQLNKNIINLLPGIDAQIYILSCSNSDEKQTKENLIQAVKTIRAKKPQTPVLLTAGNEHSDDYLNQRHHYADSLSNSVLQDAYYTLKSNGINNIYLLDRKEIKFNINSLAENSDLSDIGHQQYATAVEKITRKILDEPTGKSSTTHPRTQKRDANIYNWEIRHRYILQSVKQKQPKVIFIGNSITHYWGGLPHGPIKSDWDVKNPFFDSLDAEDLGYGWDRIENVLWRIYHGELDGYTANYAVLLIGTNNLDVNTDAQILEGLQFVVNAIKERQPSCKILMLGLTPRRAYEERVAKLNKGIAKLAGMLNVDFADAGGFFLKPDGKVDESLFSDGLHPTVKGYKLLEDFLRPYLTERK